MDIFHEQNEAFFEALIGGGVSTEQLAVRITTFHQMWWQVIEEGRILRRDESFTTIKTSEIINFIDGLLTEFLREYDGIYKLFCTTESAEAAAFIRDQMGWQVEIDQPIEGFEERTESDFCIPTPANIKFVIISIIASKVLEVDESKAEKYSLTGNDYMTIAELRATLDDPELHLTDYMKNKVIRTINESGLLMISYDEHHFPPLPEMDNTIKNMVSACLAIFTHNEVVPQSVEDVRTVLNEIIYLFDYFDEKIYERPRVREEMVQRVFEVLMRYF